MRIVLDDAKLDASAARLASVAAGLQGVQGRINPGLSAGAPPAIKGQVDALIGEARATVAAVAGRAPARARELRRRAILARLAGGDIRAADLRQLRAWQAERPFVNEKIGNGKVDDDGGFLGGLKAFADDIKDAGGDVAGAIGKYGPEVGHTTLDILGLVPGFGEPVDGVNALIYAAEGDEVNAGLRAAGMVPFLGWGATGGKIGGKIKRVIDAGGEGAVVPKPPKSAYHHTHIDNVKSINKTGLRRGAYVTDRKYTPGDATVYLALPPENANPGGILKVDLAKMRRDGINVPEFTTVRPQFGQPGGGVEIQFDGPIKPKYISIVKK